MKFLTFIITLLLPVLVSGETFKTQQQAKELYFSDIETVIPNIAMDIRYYTDFNFVGEQIDGYHQPKCFLTNQAAKALKAVQEELVKEQLSLKIYDCYRPQQAVDHFVRWASDLNDTKMKSVFYPKVPKKDLFARGYIAAKSGHSRGSTVDLTIVPIPVPLQKPYQTGKEFQDNSIDMGSPYDYFDAISHTENPAVSPQAHSNRMKLKQLMETHGFKNLPEEWWHFTLENEPFPNQYFNFPVE